MAAREGLKADAGMLKPDQCEPHLPLDVLELRTQLLGGEHTQTDLFQQQLKVGEVVPEGDAAATRSKICCCEPSVADNAGC